MVNFLVVLLTVLLFTAKLAVIYALVPFVLMHVLNFAGVNIGFWLCVGICFLFYFVIGRFKK